MVSDIHKHRKQLIYTWFANLNYVILSLYKHSEEELTQGLLKRTDWCKVGARAATGVSEKQFCE